MSTSGDLKRKTTQLPDQVYIPPTQVPKPQDVLVYWRTLLLAVLREFYHLDVDTVTYKDVYENIIGGDKGLEELNRGTLAKLNEFLTRRNSKVSPMILMYLLNFGFNDESPVEGTHFNVWEKFTSGEGGAWTKPVSIAKDVVEFTTRFHEGRYKTGEFLFQRGTGYLYMPVVEDAIKRIRKGFYDSDVVAKLLVALEKVSFVYEDMPAPPAKRARSQFSDNEEEEEGKVSVEEDEEDEEDDEIVLGEEAK